MFSNKKGFLYSFTGLRGDARNLYKKVVSGNEKRVKLVKAPTVADQLKHVEGADLVIVACGYLTQYMNVKEDQKLVPLWSKQPFTQFDVDNKCRLCTNDGNLLMKVFGSGLAFPMRSNDGQMIPVQGKPNPRADSYALYLNFVANTMLQNLLPKNKLDNKLQKTIRQSAIVKGQTPQKPELKKVI